MKMDFYTYGHYTESGQLFYIGKGAGVRAHCKTSRSRHWKNKVAKDGLRVEIFARWPTEKEAFEHERFLISCFRDTLGTKLCNMTDGGEGSSGWVPSLEMRQKASVASKAKWQDAAFQAKMANRPKGTFTEKKLISSVANAEKAHASLREPGLKALAAAKNSEKAKAMWEKAEFREKMKQTHAALWNEDRRAHMSNQTGGRVRMTDGVKERNVLPADVGSLLEQGWVFGRGPNRPSKRTALN